MQLQFKHLHTMGTYKKVTEHLVENVVTCQTAKFFIDHVSFVH